MRGIEAGGRGASASERPLSVVALWALGSSVPISALVAASSAGAPGRSEIGNVAQGFGRSADARAAG